MIETEYTSKYAIRSADPALVRLLLDNGADPNLPFGSFHT